MVSFNYCITSDYSYQQYSELSLVNHYPLRLRRHKHAGKEINYRSRVLGLE